MINPMSPLPPHPTNAEFGGLLALLNLIGNRDEHAARLEQLRAATDEARAAIAEATTAQKTLAAERSTHQTGLDEAAAEHERVLRHERDQHNEHFKARETAVTERESRAEKREKKLAVAEEACAKLKADLDRRLAALKAAAE